MTKLLHPTVILPFPSFLVFPVNGYPSILLSSTIHLMLFRFAHLGENVRDRHGSNGANINFTSLITVKIQLEYRSISIILIALFAIKRYWE